MRSKRVWALSGVEAKKIAAANNAVAIEIRTLLIRAEYLLGHSFISQAAPNASKEAYAVRGAPALPGKLDATLTPSSITVFRSARRMTI